MSENLRTPSETLMSALSECETAENVVIIMRHAGDISWHQTTNSRADLLGMLEFVACCVKGKIMQEEIAHDD